MIKFKRFYLIIFELYLMWFCVIHSGTNSSSVFLTYSPNSGFMKISWFNLRKFGLNRVIIITSRNFHSYDELKTNLSEVDCFEEITEPTYKEGFYCFVKPQKRSDSLETKIPYYPEWLGTLKKNTTCYGYWAKIYTNRSLDFLETVACLKAEPIWMNRMRPRIEALRFQDLFLPGTHDSGAFQIENALMSIESNYALTQEDDIYTQLMHGIRYLDIRIGYYPKDSKHKFWINHSTYKMMPLIDAIEQVKKFVRLTNEIVIFDIQEFPVGFETLDIHSQLIKFLKIEFNDVMVNPKHVYWHSILGDIWSTNKTVIVSYDDHRVYNEFKDILFEAVQQKWGNKQTWNELKQYLIDVSKKKFDNDFYRPSASMAELTPNTKYIATHLLGSKRIMADEVNLDISQLYAEDLYAKANIVTLDYYRGSYIVEIALKENVRRIGNYKHRPKKC